MAAYGVDRGREATAEALAAGWERWEQVRKMGNPLGYCYRVGQSRTRPHKTPVVYSVPGGSDLWVEPRLPRPLHRCPNVSAWLSCSHAVTGYRCPRWPKLMRSRPSTVQTHVARGLAGLPRSSRWMNPARMRDLRVRFGRQQQRRIQRGGTTMDDLLSTLPDQIRALFPGDSAAVSVEEAIARTAHGKARPDNHWLRDFLAMRPRPFGLHKAIAWGLSC